MESKQTTGLAGDYDCRIIMPDLSDNGIIETQTGRLINKKELFF